ncbi:MAG: hypothetical protein ACI4DW_08105 [Lachnospiraceae bacterium]
MARCRCDDMEQCRKQINVLDKQNRERNNLEKDIVWIQEIYGNLLPARKECYKSIHKGALDDKNVILRKKPGGISENAGRRIGQKRADIEAALSGMQEEDRQFHEEEREREEREKAEMLILGRR